MLKSIYGKHMNLLLWVNDKGPFNLEIKQEPFIIGRDEDCDFQIQNDSISRKHLCLEVVKDTLLSSDLQSHNGIQIKKKSVGISRNIPVVGKNKETLLIWIFKYKY